MCISAIIFFILVSTSKNIIRSNGWSTWNNFSCYTYLIRFLFNRQKRNNTHRALHKYVFQCPGEDLLSLKCSSFANKWNVCLFCYTRICSSLYFLISGYIIKSFSPIFFFLLPNSNCLLEQCFLWCFELNLNILNEFFLSDWELVFAVQVHENAVFLAKQNFRNFMINQGFGVFFRLKRIWMRNLLT